MKSIFLTFILVLLFISTSFSQTPQPTAAPIEDDDIVKISTALIQIDVTVTDKKGNVIKDLKPEDFEIYENGKKQEITNFSFISAINEQNKGKKKIETNVLLNIPPASTEINPDQVRRTIALVVDDLTLSFESVSSVRRALKKFVDEQIREGDLVAIIRTGGGIGALQQFTSDKRQLYAAIEKVRWNPSGSGDITAFSAIEPSALEKARAAGANISQEQIEEDKRRDRELRQHREDVFATGSLGAINHVIRGMRDLPGRKSIFLLSDGFRLTSESLNGFTDSSSTLESMRQLIDLANRSSVVIYTFDTRGLQPIGFTARDRTAEIKQWRREGGTVVNEYEKRVGERRDELQDKQEGLIYLAKETGGFTIINNNDLNNGIERVLNDQSYYLIGYQPDNETFDPEKSRFNKLIVKVKREGADVRYRSGFFGISDEQLKKKAIYKTTEQQILSAISSPFAVNDISLQLNTLFGNDSEKGSFIRSLLYIRTKDLKFTEESDGSKRSVFDVLAITFGDNGVPIDQISKTYTVNLKDEKYRKFLDEGFVYYFTFPVKKPGAYQMRAAIRDHTTGKVGSASQFIEIPNLKKNQLTLSSNGVSKRNN